MPYSINIIIITITIISNYVYSTSEGPGRLLPGQRAEGCPSDYA